MGRDAFLLCSGSWYPLLLPVKGIFAKGGERPDPTQISIWVPKDFVALSSGRAAGTHRRNGEFEHRFRLSRQDFDPLSSRAAITSRRCKRPMAQSSSGRSNPPRPSKCNARARVSRPRSEPMNSFCLLLRPSAARKSCVGHWRGWFAACAGNRLAMKISGRRWKRKRGRTCRSSFASGSTTRDPGGLPRAL